MHIKDEKKMKCIHIAKIQLNQTKIVRKVGLSYRYMLLTNKTPINQRKTEIHKSIGITTMFYRFQLHCRIIIKITIKMFHRLNMRQ